MAMFETSSFVATATFLGAVIALVTTAFMWNRRQAPGAASVAWLMIAAAIWSGGYGIEVLLEDIDAKLLLVPIEYVGISTVPVFWFVTAAHLTGRIRSVTPRLLLILSPRVIIEPRGSTLTSTVPKQILVSFKSELGTLTARIGLSENARYVEKAA
jgi:hypothetical protein